MPRPRVPAGAALIALVVPTLARVELALDPVELGRGPVQPPAVAQQRDQHDQRDPDRPELPAARPTPTQIPVQTTNSAAPPPASWISGAAAALRRSTSSALRCCGLTRQLGQVGQERVELLLGLRL